MTIKEYENLTPEEIKRAQDDLIRAYIEEGGDIAMHEERVARCNNMALERILQDRKEVK